MRCAWPQLISLARLLNLSLLIGRQSSQTTFRKEKVRFGPVKLIPSDEKKEPKDVLGWS